jgi:hypothetical protein
MQVEIRKAVLRDASWVMANMRQLDREEVYAQWPDTLTTAELATGLLFTPGAETFVAYLKDEPVALFGTSPMTVNCLWVWALGTDRMERAVPEITRFFMDYHMPRRIEQGYTCAEARSLVTHGVAHRWIEGMGGKKLGGAFEFGKGGEHFVLYRWTVAGYRAIGRKTGATR